MALGFLTSESRLASWFEYVIQPSGDLLLAYARQVDEQINASLDHFRANVQEAWHDSGDPERPEFSVRTYGHLNDVEWDMEDVFLTYFPNLQRGASVVTIYAVFEREIISLCGELQKALQLRVSLKDLHGKGIEQAITYLELVCGIDAAKQSQEFSEVKDVQRIRGALAHGGRVDLTRNVDLGRALRHSELLGHKGSEANAELTLGAGYPQEVVLAFLAYFKLLSEGLKSFMAARMQ